jgi:hypothetical protein
LILNEETFEVMSHQKPTTPVRKSKPLMRRWSTWIALGLVALIGLVGSIPTILGSKWLYQRLVDQLAIEGFRLKVDSAQFAWFRPLAINGIELEQLDLPEKPRGLLSIESIASNRSLMGYLLGGRNLGTITLRKPKLDIELLENSSNIEKLARSIENSTLSAQKNSSKSKPKLDIQVVVEDLSVGVRRQETGQELLVVPPVDLDLHYLALDGNARLEFAETKLLDQVQVTQELVRLGLGRAVPLLAKSAWFDGRVSLHVDKLEIPLEQPAYAKGRAELTLHEVRSGPSEPIVVNIIDMISRLRKTEIPQELVFIDGSIIQVALAEGRVEHQGVQVGFPKIDQRLQLSTSGSVGLVDRQLDVGLRIPVPLEMLARRESVQQIGVPQVTLPVRGTIESPYVDWKSLRGDSADLLSLVSAALGDEAPGTAAIIDVASGVTSGKADEAIGAAVDLIKELRQRRLERKAKSSSQSDPGPIQPIDQKSNEPSKSESPRRPLRDALKNILGGSSSGG